MPLFSEQIDSKTHWGIWKVTETEKELLSLLLHADYYLDELQKFHAPSRRIEWLAVRVLLNHLLQRTVTISYYPNGRPYLSDESFALSISHTKGYVAVLLAPSQCRVGIDIEQVGERVRKVVPRFMNSSEKPSFYKGSDLYSLLLHWSAKESFYKCLDQTEVDFLEHLHVVPFQVQSEGTFDIYETCTPEKTVSTVDYFLHPDFVLTRIVC